MITFKPKHYTRFIYMFQDKDIISDKPFCSTSRMHAETNVGIVFPSLLKYTYRK